MNTNSISIYAYESIAGRSRCIQMTAIIFLIVFLIWIALDQSSFAFYYLALVVCYLLYAVTQSWLAERKYFGRAGPLDCMMGDNSGVRLWSKTKTTLLKHNQHKPKEKDERKQQQESPSTT